jgi:integrase
MPKTPKPKRTRRASPGEGMIREHKKGLWEVRISLGFDKNGKRKDLSRYTSTKAEAIQLRAEMLLAHNKGQLIKDEISLEQWLLKHRTDREAEGVRVTTLNTYTQYERILEPLAQTPIHKLTTEQLEGFYRGLAQEGYSKSVVRHVHWHVKAALKRARRYKYVEDNVADYVQLPDIKERKRAQIFTDAQAQELLEVARKSEVYSRLFPILFLALRVGLRRGEILGLQWQDIRWDKGLIQIRRAVVPDGGKVMVTGVKTESSERDIPLTKAVREVLEEQRDRVMEMKLPPECPWVFPSEAGTPLNPHNVLRSYYRLLEIENDARAENNKKLSKAQQLEMLPRLRIHDMRHTFTSRAVKVIGVKATSKILGHAKIEQTLDTYTHLLEEDLKAAIGMLEPNSE